MVAEKVTTPSLEDVIAFGGIPCVNNSGVRTSSRIREQNDADDTQLARAMKNTEQRFASASGYSYGDSLGAAMGAVATVGAAGCYGYWMQTSPDGCSGYLIPGWLASY